ncbi:hypothetical protein HNQ94_001268 [Salirhabdus euzebyi]|uniref:Sporulation inhibitor of replication protein SirA n=1 Tax=Salirhabdus euzebyi TaxID=394506 RepID=A0A841Q2G7_9BACI|nr:sporulation inhibitor of replication protein SirA [Salirhabdus euzebyi]MBB6452822.1 hypothetical protein [Salirhabdus euzebyi]
MQTFSIFLIKDEFVKHYYHKNDLLYDFFQTYRLQSYDPNYQKQFQFITKDIPKRDIITYLCDKLNGLYTIHKADDELWIENNHLHVKIECGRKEWVVYSSSLHEAELVVFEHFRALHTSFFVMNRNKSQYGWLSPIRKEVIL